MFDIRVRMLVLAAAFVLDALLGDPHVVWHPIRGIGLLIAHTEKLLRKLFRIRDARSEKRERAAGVLLVIIVVLVSVSIPAVFLYAAWRIHYIVGIVLECIMCYRLLAMRSLAREAKKVYLPLAEGDTEQARAAVSMIVGRDTEKLDDAGIAKAAVETVAENTSDGVVAPLIYMCLFGACGGFLYKAVNTMDSMVGYKNDKYIHFGRAAAMLDDILNLIPSRLSALFMLLATGVLKMPVRRAWKIYRRDRKNHDSPNSAQTEAVCAGALGIRLAGDAYYFGKRKEKPTIGDAVRDVEPCDILRAIRLMVVTSLLALAFLLLLCGLCALVFGC